ncbi:MAG TPA: ABC transporter substrate-binding protein, partial [Candidatus Udaeobacter sp.]|nr:ABC transporter substrate-binding protein [Candidatus Udaeobacter sp.]
MKKSLKATLVLMLIVSMTLLAACSGNTKETKKGTPDDPITIALSPWPGWYMWYLVEEKGFFEKHGVNVKLEFFPVYSDSLQAIAAGKVD